eukprot:TRINITY_DN22874_c0_g1_i1.p1 TRINITY_DN22874_c0_g1~~TRINITY_DN22874_c0_g1_i1.p1  ORF type:complete len:523 (+),score=130.62 TRINITY_DN22874_c0_g1_i1:126-1694(+)
METVSSPLALGGGVRPRSLFADAESPGSDDGGSCPSEVCIIHHDDMQLHIPPNHKDIYELPRRVIAIENKLKGLETREGFPPEGNFGGPMQLLPAARGEPSNRRGGPVAFGSPATKRRRVSYSTGPSSAGSAWDACRAVPAPEVSDSDLLLVHSERHLRVVSDACELAKAQCAAYMPLHGSSARMQRKPREEDANRDLFYSPGSAAAFRRAAGGAVQAVRELFRTDPRTGRAAGRAAAASFAIVRPPGHHCCDEPAGFCFFNNTAVAASHARAVLGLSRVAIIDWDYHHGDATQELFYRDPSVLTISLHVSLTGDGIAFPNNRSMGLEHNGLGLGRGYNINIPWPHDGVGAADYEEAFQTVVLPALREYRPELILVACGFDAMAGDILAGTRLPASGYYSMTRHLLGLEMPLALVLEGGYNPSLIAEAALNVVHALLGRPAPPKASRCSELSKADGPGEQLAAAHVLDAVRRRLNTLPPWRRPEGSNEAPCFREDDASGAKVACEAAALELKQLIDSAAHRD